MRKSCCSGFLPPRILALDKLLATSLGLLTVAFVASGVFAVTIGAAKADTLYDVQGTSSDGAFSGTFTVDGSGNVSSVNIDFPARSFFDVFVEISLPTPGVDGLQVDNTDSPLDELTLDFDFVSQDLIGFMGGAITGGSIISNGMTVVSDITGTITETPLPAALPLFATGLGAMGLLGWRRKRKNAAAIATA
jgi:hypothetical protein